MAEKTMEFIGFADDVFYGEGVFTVGKRYKIDITTVRHYPHGRHPDAAFIDDDEDPIFEELRYFRD